MKHLLIGLLALVSFCSCSQDEPVQIPLVQWTCAEEFITGDLKVAVVAFSSESHIDKVKFKTVWYYKHRQTGAMISFTLYENNENTNPHDGLSYNDSYARAISPTGFIWIKAMDMGEIPLSDSIYILDHADMSGEFQMNQTWFTLKTQTYHKGDELIDSNW
jgi:hypothetical protein